MGLHCSFHLHLLHEIADALCSKPHHCSFPFSCIPCSQIILTTEPAQNSHHTHNIMVTSTRNLIEGEQTASGKLGSPCQNTLSSSSSPSDIELFAILLPLVQSRKIPTTSYSSCHSLGVGAVIQTWDIYLTLKKGRRESPVKVRKIQTQLRFLRHFQITP